MENGHHYPSEYAWQFGERRDHRAMQHDVVDDLRRRQCRTIRCPMPSSELESIVETLRSRPRLADYTIPELRVVFEETMAQFPVVGGGLSRRG